MSEISVKKWTIKRFFVVATVLAWGLIIGILSILAAITSPEDSAQGALIVIAVFPVIAFIFLIWVVSAVGFAITMFVAKSRSKPTS